MLLDLGRHAAVRLLGDLVHRRPNRRVARALVQAGEAALDGGHLSAFGLSATRSSRLIVLVALALRIREELGGQQGREVDLATAPASSASLAAAALLFQLLALLGLLLEQGVALLALAFLCGSLSVVKG